ncbi:MAG: sarcosine oxidase subunit alpha family protein [Rhodobacteraceae bacterium]|nr:sarcosine oxidase subunit alpha family protein [Paracoccaceae bacterium]
MAHRLDTGGRLIDRAAPMDFSFNGKGFRGFAGDTLASALLASDQMLMGRSFKYHRPRGVVARGHEEPNALMNIGAGPFFEPNQRATVTPLTEGLEAESQNHWPSLETDAGAVNGLLSRFLPAGFYYKTFIHPRPAWKHLFEPFIRQSAGLGRAPKEPDGDRYEHFYRFCDVLIAGGGIAGLQAALKAGESGARVLLLEQAPVWGGRAAIDGDDVDGQPAADWIAGAVARLEAMPNVALHTGVMVSGVYDHGYVLAAQPVPGHRPGSSTSRERLWRIRTDWVEVAAGAIERPLSFAGNDIPGVMLAGAVRDYLADFAVVAGARTVVVTNNDDAYRTALALHAAGQAVPAIIDARAETDSPLIAAVREAGLRIAFGTGIAQVVGGKRVTGVRLCPQSGDGTMTEEIRCDAVAMSGGWSPAVHLFSQCGGKLTWDADQAFFRPDPERAPMSVDGTPFVFAVGAANGHLESAAAQADAAGTPIPAATEALIAPVWRMPAQAPVKLREKTWLDFQNDVKVSDVQLAAREGFESVEHAKRYTTLGMATDQGKLSNVNGLAVLGDALGREIPQVGTTTFRPPYVPLNMGSIAGEARGPIFQPLRKTPMDAWHESHGAHWEPVGHWRRPYCFQRSGESMEDAVAREILSVRREVGLLDASTLGKILVKGPDAGRFLDMLYTNMMSTLAPGRCRYGLMCSENGFLMDDGVVARIDDDTWLCHTTTGGADNIHGHMEDWLQTEWWDWKVWTQNLTEQFAQIAVVGPNARTLLERLGGMDLSAEALPFMRWAEGEIAGIPARVFRISFSGELSYEIAVPAGRGLELWERLVAEGADLGVAPYGTEALHVLRAEKGFIMIGDETDGTVIPQDLGLDWAISKKKTDYLGKAAQARAHMTDPERWKLVGLETLDGTVLPDGAYAVTEGNNELGQRNMIGRVTSSYRSPTLERGIAMGLVQRGPERMGEVLDFPLIGGGVTKARIASPVFYDPEGERLHG